MLIAALPIATHHWPGEIRQRQRVDDGARIALDQRLRYFLTTNFGSGDATSRKDRNPLLGIVSVSRQHVDGFAFQQTLREAPHAFAPESGKGGAGHLNHASLFSPLNHPLRTLAKNRIAFGMRDHSRHAAVAEFKETIRGLRRDAVVAQLD